MVRASKNLFREVTVRSAGRRALDGTLWAQGGSVLTLTLMVVLSQCTKDTDCKGDRICSAGACVDSRPELTPKNDPSPAVRLQIEQLSAQRPALYVPISTLVLGAVLTAVAGILLPIQGHPGISYVCLISGLSTLAGGSISLGTTLWARSQVGQMIERLEAGAPAFR